MGCIPNPVMCVLDCDALLQNIYVVIFTRMHILAYCKVACGLQAKFDLSASVSSEGLLIVFLKLVLGAWCTGVVCMPSMLWQL